MFTTGWEATPTSQLALPKLRSLWASWSLSTSVAMCSPLQRVCLDPAVMNTSIGASEPSDILFIIGGLDVGGTERHLLSVGQQLRRADWRVWVYSLAGDGPLRSGLEAAGVCVALPPVSRAEVPNIKILRALRLALAAVHLTYTMVRLRPRIAHFLL